MIQWILDLVNSLVNIVQSAFHFLISTISSIFRFLQVLPSYITYITSLIGFLPSFLVLFATITVVISVLYFILNR